MDRNCGLPKSDGGGQSFGAVLKGDHNKFYHNTVLRTAQADVVIATGSEGPNHFTLLVNNIASRWSGKNGPRPPTPAQKSKGNWGGNVEVGRVGMFEDFAHYDFRPRNSSEAAKAGVLHPPEIFGPTAHPDAGAYQSSDANPWVPGCTFSSQCLNGLPPPPEPCDAMAPAGWKCNRSSYCGPKESFYFAGGLTFAECSARCVANSTGCHCFDHLDGDAGAEARIHEEEGVEVAVARPLCRLHASAADIVTNNESPYTAYWTS